MEVLIGIGSAYSNVDIPQWNFYTSTDIIGDNLLGRKVLDDNGELSYFIGRKDSNLKLCSTIKFSNAKALQIIDYIRLFLYFYNAQIDLGGKVSELVSKFDTGKTISSIDETKTLTFWEHPAVKLLNSNIQLAYDESMKDFRLFVNPLLPEGMVQRRCNIAGSVMDFSVSEMKLLIDFLKK